MVDPPGLNASLVEFYSISFTATDSQGLFAVESFNLTVLFMNSPPELHNLPDTVTIAENVTSGFVLFWINATDREGDVIFYNYTISPNTNVFYLTGADGNFIYFLNFPSVKLQIQKVNWSRPNTNM